MTYTIIGNNSLISFLAKYYIDLGYSIAGRCFDVDQLIVICHDFKHITTFTCLDYKQGIVIDMRI